MARNSTIHATALQVPALRGPVRAFTLGAWLCGLLAALLGVAGCGGLKMRAAVERVNTAAPKGEPPPERTPTERIAHLTVQHLTDAYYSPDELGRWLEALARNPAPLIALVGCINDARRNARSAADCHAAFAAPDGPARAWGLPSAPPTTASHTDPGAQREVDAARFVANARALGASLSELAQSFGGVLQACPAGIAAGARRAAAYLGARSWTRGPRPTTAVVLGGGSANGAFSAGFVWRMLDVLEQCRNAASGGCGESRIDLVVGTSTGTLIGALVDLYFTPGKEREAMQLLLDNYTCSVEADLYCVPDEYVWKIAHDARGLVRFSGIASKIDHFITREVERNALELVGVTMDLRYGEVLGFSDQDPADATSNCGRRDALLASIVLPVMAEPVSSIELRKGTRAGPFVDGGVSSIVPMLEAVRRGAERVVVLSNYPIVPEPEPPARNAIEVLLRSLALAMLHPGPSEVERGELYAHARRRLEHQVCVERLRSFATPAESAPLASAESTAGASSPTPAVDQVAFCKRQFGAGSSPASWSGALPDAELSEAFRSAWVFRTEGIASERGYAFEPKAMRELFVRGMHAFQDRCHELLDVLGIEGSVAQAACAERKVEARPRFREIKQCGAREIPECRGPITCPKR
jgi:predicted acylesterase/phospholipase RssA